MMWRLRKLASRHAPTWVRFGLLGRTTPVSSKYGYDRGTPIDRYYIADFLREHSADIAGRTLEVGDDAYTREFGGSRARQRDTIHLNPAVPATFHGDMSQDGVLPRDAYDCAVITQTLQFIYDVRSALANLHDALKPGGTLLLTVPGITRIGDEAWVKDWYWALTPASLQLLLEEQFGDGQIVIRSYGNVFAATSLLYGLATEEVPRAKLDVVDHRYPVILGARVTRKADQRSS